jgi:multiple sugar transport system substrate-binding protein
MIYRPALLVSRRSFLKAAGVAAMAVGMGVLVPRQVRAQQKTLKILQWKHFVPGYDTWFNDTYVKTWGEQHDTRVSVDNIGLADLHDHAAAEIVAQRGHDLVMFLSPKPAYEDQVIDHREIYEECERQYGKAADLARQSTYNLTTNKFFGFSHSYVPLPINYRKDLWDAVGVMPDTWEDIRRGGRTIRQLHGLPIGLGLASEIDSNMTALAILYAFGAAMQNAENRPTLQSKEALEALKFVKALYVESMTDDVLTWTEASNNQLMLAGQGSLALNAISITRTAENKRMPIGEHIWLARAAQGPVQRLALNLTQTYIIWKFAENIDGARQFLVDYIGQFRQALLASALYNLPCFSQTVPDLGQLCARDAQARPPDKYKILADALTWTTHLGYPGYMNAAIDEIFNTWLLSTMFAQAATGKLSPEEALQQADTQVQRIFQTWRERGKV